MSWKGDKLNVTFVFALVIVLVNFKCGHGADVGVHSTRDLQISSHNSLLSSDGNRIANRMLHIRQTIQRLFSSWNLGESGFQGKNIFIDMFKIKH